MSSKNLKQIRKLLAGAGENTLIFQRTKYGYAVKGYGRPPCQLLLGWHIQIHGVLEWSVGYCGFQNTDLFKLVRDVPQVIFDPVASALSSLVEEFPHLKGNGMVEAQIRYANSQEHGTALIFVDFENEIAQKRITRLYDYERSLKADIKDISDLKAISAMDGGIVIDVNKRALNGSSVAFVSTIVDGLVNTTGLLDRGARHNSIHTFVANIAEETGGQSGVVCALVFSEDGGIVVFRGSQIKLSRIP